MQQSPGVVSFRSESREVWAVKRREFIKLLGGAAARAARQQRKLPRRRHRRYRLFLRAAATPLCLLHLAARKTDWEKNHARDRSCFAQYRNNGFAAHRR
jgi:hypothetical protein